MIVAIFGQKGRQHRSRDNTLSTLDEITERYRLAAHSCQASTLSDIESVKRDYQAEIRKGREQAAP
jgi:hypothetical protein